MKHLLICLCLSISIVSLADAQTKGRNAFLRFWDSFKADLFTPQIHKPFSVSGGMEINHNDRINMVPEIFITGDYEFTRYFGIGVRGGLTFGSSEPADRQVSVMDGAAFGRFYLYDFGWIRPYVQAGVGMSMNREMEYGYTDVLGEFAAGVRAHWKAWFTDMNVRYGYPFQIAVALSAGHSFLP